MEQGLLPIPPQAVPEDRLLDERDIRLCNSFESALRVTFRNTRVPLSQEELAAAFDKTPGTFSQILNNDLHKAKFDRDQAKQTGGKGSKFLPRYFDNNLIKKAIQISGNAGILQYLCLGTPWKVVRKTPQEMREEREQFDKDKRIRELEAELAKLRAA